MTPYRRVNRRERLYRFIFGHWPRSVVDRRLEQLAALWGEDVSAHKGKAA